MAGKPTDTSKARRAADQRAARLAAALRANLGRRKAQTRARDADDVGPDGPASGNDTAEDSQDTP